MPRSTYGGDLNQRDKPSPEVWHGVQQILAQIPVAAHLATYLVHNTAQRAADFRRRINETYSKAVSQLASDKLEERLGGIYTLENISKESPDDYRTVMETLSAFVRERARKK